MNKQETVRSLEVASALRGHWNDLVVIVRCRHNHTREIGPGEVGPSEIPMCKVCYRPMFAVQVRTRRKTG